MKQRIIKLDSMWNCWPAVQDIIDAFDSLDVEWRLYMTLDAATYFIEYEY